ncbi:hypothetical protein M2101_000419 [Parabacteroides sp. PM5-20]|uniref:N-acetylmuramoyl-L-alanine amidase-like domain-containing protein n=1 Tax=Parabacteroides sp. PM5-20 TaxID=2940527 RepID=UPI0024765900|nr:N-acetylmuramoyl-L-alanine amidase-like domain-containing protein [Parabacteroides sp. PM5-20]MDH6533778.1 hypothetical protein [Parabacteroides sp. PM5-20]
MYLKLYIFLPFLLFLSFFCGKAHAVAYQEEDRILFERYLLAMESKKALPTADLLLETARFFLGTPYVASTLEKEPEELVVNLREMDCITFVENVISLTRTLQEEYPSFERFCFHLQQLRYRQGRITDYTDRLHYTTDWMYENERQGIFRDVTKEVGGEVLPLRLSFMSTHPGSYRPLKNAPDKVERMARIEKEISRRTYYFIPKDRIEALADSIQKADIVGFVTTIDGLDLSHVGIIYREGDKLTFMHASSVARKVIVNEESLIEYTQRIQSNKGIMLLRLPLSTLSQK